MGGRAFDVVAAVTDHEHPFGQRLQLRQGVREHIGLGGTSAVDTGSGDDLEVLVETEMGQDASRGRLCLGSGHREPDARGPQVGQQRLDPVEQAVDRPTASGVVGAVGGDRGFGVFAQAHRGQGVVHRRPDDLAGQIAIGHGGTDLAERVPEAGYDSGRGVGEGAVEVEDHQLRSLASLRCGDRACHIAIVQDAATSQRLRPDTGLHREAVNVSVVASVDSSASIPLAAARYHGDQAAEPGMLDFAVNIRHAQPPVWLVERLAARLTDLARYPGVDDERAAIEAVAARHGRSPDQVALLAGAAEAFALLPNLRPTLAAVIAPSFTEPDVALSVAGVRVHHVVLDPPFGLAGVQIPDAADLVVVGNPTNPTSVLHPREQILALRRPGRIVVVDEAFADSVPGEPESLANEALPDVLVLRSLTKTWSLAGLRVGYALAAPDVLGRLTAARPHWPVGTLQLAAVAACCAPGAVAEAEAGARRLAAMRAEMVSGLQSAGVHPVDGRAPFVLFAIDDAELTRKHLHARGIAVRRCDTFVGLDGRYLRAAVRPEWPVLVEAVADITNSGVLR
jgi:histidinol-phosphate aminotransferase